MSAREPDPDDDQRQPAVSSGTVLMMLGDIADTTWRMFVPTIGFALIGYMVGRAFGMAIVFALVGVLLGAGIAALLVRQQLRKVKR